MREKAAWGCESSRIDFFSSFQSRLGPIMSRNCRHPIRSPMDPATQARDHVSMEGRGFPEASKEIKWKYLNN